MPAAAVAGCVDEQKRSRADYTPRVPEIVAQTIEVGKFERSLRELPRSFLLLLTLPSLPGRHGVRVRPQPPPLLPGVVLQAVEVVLLDVVHEPARQSDEADPGEKAELIICCAGRVFSEGQSGGSL